jgi:hypothetical protein
MGDSKQEQKEKVGRAIDELFEAALNYARAKKFGAVFKEGTWIKWTGTDQQMYEEIYLTQLAQVAVQLLMEVSLC